MSKNEEEFSKEIEQIFIERINWGKRTAKLLLAGVAIAIAVGVATWFSANPIDRDEIHSGLALGLAGSVFFVICMVARIFDPKPIAKCPKCECDWSQESQDDSQWLNWKCCPSCGLNLNDNEPDSYDQ